MGVTAELTAIAIGVGVVGAAVAITSVRSDSCSSSSVIVRTGIAGECAGVTRRGDRRGAGDRARGDVARRDRGSDRVADLGGAGAASPGDAPEGDRGPDRARLRADDIVPHLRDDQVVFVCGSAPFTDAVGDLLVELGVKPERARFERFGPSA